MIFLRPHGRHRGCRGPTYKYLIVADFQKVASVAANTDKCLHLRNQAAYFAVMGSPDVDLFSSYSANEKNYKAKDTQTL